MGKGAGGGVPGKGWLFREKCCRLSLKQTGRWRWVELVKSALPRENLSSSLAVRKHTVFQEAFLCPGELPFRCFSQSLIKILQCSLHP